MAFLLLLFQLTHDAYHLTAYVAEGFVVQCLHILLLSCHLIQAYQHLLNGYGDIGTAFHAGIPGERAVRILQFLQFLHSCGKPVADGILVEEVGQTLFLF